MFFPDGYKNDQTSPTKRNTLAIVPRAAALEALAEPSLPDQEAMQLVHDIWCHPGNNKMEQFYKARRGRGFPRGFITQLRKFHCATCAVSKLTRRYQRDDDVLYLFLQKQKIVAEFHEYLEEGEYCTKRGCLEGLILMV